MEQIAFVNWINQEGDQCNSDPGSNGGKVGTYCASLCMHVMQGTLNTCMWLQITAVLELCLMSVGSVKI